MINKSKTTKPMPLGTLNYLNSQGKIWLNPRYQRESVWTRSQKQLLVDSIFRDIDIPKIYFREVADDSGHEFEVVDGQQRLRSVFEFMADEFPMATDADSVDENDVAGKRFSALATNLQMKFHSTAFDVVIYNAAFTETDIEETFLRMQNGTPLNAAEKRRAIAGNMRTVVEELSKHRVFRLAGFSDNRYAFEDAVARVLHQLLAGNITDIRAGSIVRTYKAYPTLTIENKEVRRLKKAFGFIAGAFDGLQSPKFKKYSMVTLPYLVAELLETYDLSKHPTAFAETFLDFETKRITNEELPEDEQNGTLAAYTDAARSDSLPDMKYRYDILKYEIISAIPALSLKDPNRSFTDEQRLAIFRRDRGVCQFVGCGMLCDESEFHADHKVPYSRGGRTTVENGQVLCAMHNLSKGDRDS